MEYNSTALRKIATQEIEEIYRSEEPGFELGPLAVRKRIRRENRHAMLVRALTMEMEALSVSEVNVQLRD